MRQFSLFIILILWAALSSAQIANRDSVSLVDALRPLYDISLLPSYQSHTRVAQVSSYDTTGGNNDGFNGTYSYLRRNADSSLVIFEQTGPGIIERIWTPTPNEDSLDFYFDGSDRPGLTVRFLDLFSGKQEPFKAPLCGNQLGGYYCYFPIAFRQSCKIVTRGKLIQFFQIQYRTYAAGTRMQPFHLAQSGPEKKAVADISTVWNKIPGQWPAAMPAEKTLRQTQILNINPGEQKKLFEFRSGGTISALTVKHKAGFHWNNQLDIRISWDDDKIPAVYCPISDFFGYAFGNPSMQSLLAGSTDTLDYFFFPMPFDRKATIEIIYRAGADAQPVDGLPVSVYYTAQPRRADTQGRFYSWWKSNSYSAAATPHVFLSAQAKGHYVGSVLQARGLHAGMTYFFEGDDSTAIDGEQRLHGTGSEDYFNGGWYALLDRWERKMSLPIHGALDYSLVYGRTGGYRFYLSDKLSFEKNIFQSIEHGPVNNIPAAYTSLAFYYADRPTNGADQPTNALTAIHQPDTLMMYPQLMKFSVEGDVHSRTAWATNTGGLSFLFSSIGESWLSIPLDELPKGKYRVLADFTQVPDGVSFSLWQRQTQLSEWIDASAPTKTRNEYRYLADININDQFNTMTIRLKAGDAPKTFFFNRMTFVRMK